MSERKKLLTIEDTFLIAGRGLIVVPGVPIKQFAKPIDLEVELRKPDGSISQAVLSLQYTFQTPPPKVRRYACIFRNLDKNDVPLGTEVWHSNVIVRYYRPIFRTELAEW